ncbi:endonuclease, partial [Luteibacter rhizovicinus DSM 16549]
TITYVWTVDDIAQDSTAATMDYTLASPAGTKKIKVVATNTLSAGDPEIAEASTTITVNKKENNSTIAVTPASPAAVEIGTATTFTANVSNQPSGAAIAYTWKV